MSPSSITLMIGFASLSGVAAWLQARWQGFWVLSGAVALLLVGMFAMKLSDASIGLEAALDPPDSNRQLLVLGLLLFTSAPYVAIGAATSALSAQFIGVRNSIILTAVLGLTLSSTIFRGLFQ